MGHIRSATMRHAICTVSGLMSQVACLPRTHPLVENETLDDRALEGVWLGNNLSTPMF